MRKNCGTVRLTSFQKRQLKSVLMSSVCSFIIAVFVILFFNVSDGYSHVSKLSFFGLNLVAVSFV